MPPDNRKTLMQYLKEEEMSLVGVSDASIKNGQSTHAWILTTGEPHHLTDPYMSISGSGPVDGHEMDLSTA
jgi:hypothetical protein